MAKHFVLGSNAARKFRELVGTPRVRPSRTSAADVISLDDSFVPPFTVQWAESTASWIVWLPSDSLLKSGDGYVDITTNLESAGGDYPSGWFKLPNTFTEIATKVYLDPETGSFSPNSSASAVLIAEMSGKNVRQSVMSALVASGGSSCPPRPFDFKDGEVAAGDIPCPAERYHADAYTITKQTTSVYLHVNFSGNNYVLTINETSQAQSATHAQFKLYDITNGVVTLDCRPSVIPALAI